MRVPYREEAVITANHTVDIARPAQVVFDFVRDQRNEPKWHTDVLEVDPQEPLELGSTVTWTVKFMGTNQYVIEVTALDAPRSIRIETRDGPTKPTLTHRFESDDGATRYTRTVSIPEEGMLRIVGPIMKAIGAADRRNATFAENLKALLEG